jgi:hypothetical protein
MSAMIWPLLSWLLCSVLVFLLLVGLRRLSLKRAGRLADFHWRGMAVMAVALGAVPAILIASLPPDQVKVPDNATLDRVLKNLPLQK